MLKRFLAPNKYRRCHVILQKHSFCASKKLEFSDNADNELLASLSENELFQSISPDPSSRSRHRSIENIAWRRQIRKPREVDKNDRFAGLLNSRTVSEIRQHLDVVKTRKREETAASSKYTKKSGKEEIMAILNSISEHDNTDKVVAATPEKEMDNVLMRAYCHAISMCGFLKEFDEGYKLFEEAKANKSVLSSRIFGTVMWLIMEQELSQKSLNKCHELMNEMVNDFNLVQSPYIYSILLKNHTALRRYRESDKLIREMCRDHDFDYLLRSQTLRLAVANHYAKSKQIEEGLRFMKRLTDQFGDDVLNEVIFGSMLSGIALMIKDGDKSYINVAENLFEQSFKVLKGPPGESVFSALINCYSFVPDPESCIDVVKNMINNEDLPQPTIWAFCNCLKSLSNFYKEPIGYERGWKMIDEILDIMKNTQVAKNEYDDEVAIYGLLFSLCGGKFCNKSDLDRLYMYYDEMKSKGYKLTAPAANSLLLSGIDHYQMEILNHPDNKEAIKVDMKQYIDWAILQFKEHNLSMNAYQKERLKKKLSEIM